MHGGPPGKKPLVGFDEFLYLLKATRKMTNPHWAKGRENQQKQFIYVLIYVASSIICKNLTLLEKEAAKT